MATKKKVATKGTGKITAGAKNNSTGKKSVQSSASKASHNTLLKKPAKVGAKQVAAKPIQAKKMPETSVKPAAKNLPAKPAKADSFNEIIKKIEPVQVMPKKNENKSVEVPVNESVIPVTAKTPKKEGAGSVKTTKVAMPEIKTKSVRKYDPDFTKSVLDTPPNPLNNNSQRYSDVDLIEFRELINKKMEAAKKELNYLQGLITRKDEMGGDESDNRYMTMEDGSISMEREQLSQMASRQITFIDHLEKAIMRIENKTYGICRVTGKLIDKARLRAVPHATLSIEAKQTMNR